MMTIATLDKLQTHPIESRNEMHRATIGDYLSIIG